MGPKTATAIRLCLRLDQTGSASAGKLEYYKLEQEHRKDAAAHRGTKDVLDFARVTVFVLLMLLIGSVFMWWFVLR